MRRYSDEQNKIKITFTLENLKIFEGENFHRGKLCKGNLRLGNYVSEIFDKSRHFSALD